MSIVDRILKGEFDDNDKKPKVAAEAVDPEEFEEEEEGKEDEETEEEEDEEVNTDSTSPEIEEEEDFYDPDAPSSEFMADYAKENAGEVLEDITPTKNRSIYIEGPKQSLAPDNKPMQNVPTPKAEKPKAAPKQSTTKETPVKSSRKGPPYKLVAESEEVCRLYNEGVRAQLIAQQFNVSITCVINCLSRAGVTIRPKGRRKQNIV
jgi:hypothetical protein